MLNIAGEGAAFRRDLFYETAMSMAVHPAIAEIAMILSSINVIINSMTIKK